MKTYSVGLCVSIEVEAENECEAEDIACQSDMGDFEMWKVDYVEEI
jgi:hypothetical protein